MPNLTRKKSSTYNKRNRAKSPATHFLTNGTELVVPLQKVSEPTRNRRESSNEKPKPSQHLRARNDYDEETAYESYMNPEPGFQSGPGDSANAD